MKATIHHETPIVTRFRTFEIHRKHVGLPGNGCGFDLEKCKKSVHFWIFGFLQFRQSHASYSKKKIFFLRETTKEFLFLGCFLNTFSGNGTSTALHTTSPMKPQNFWCNFWNFASVTRPKSEKKILENHQKNGHPWGDSAHFCKKRLHKSSAWKFTYRVTKILTCGWVGGWARAGAPHFDPRMSLSFTTFTLRQTSVPFRKGCLKVVFLFSVGP